ncbi:YheC/YheD family protein [Heyndrickxia acidicola]|uniref:YheC/YheD family protein n=1 Tax=Heyndrickxia acidicola TaxID=209389 RepID=A0ABU6MD20_9BACI|nr:YheC/YheD family protein [Heyndrickxia acidicola]MED1202415.1 YheC/YheD family protein [Heyndrickxia acidicola]
MAHQITVIPSSSNKGTSSFIAISEGLMKKLNISMSPGKKLILRAGTETAVVHLAPPSNETSNNIIWMNKACFQQLRLPYSSFSFQAAVKNDYLCIGPVIAILTEWKAFEEEAAHFGTLHTFCTELQEYIEQCGGFIYLTSMSLYPGEGYYFSTGKWQKGPVPRPDIIYNRIHSRIKEKTTVFKDLAKQWQADGIPYFNDRYLSKWEIHQIINKKENLHPFLPTTDIYTAPVLEEFLHQYQDVYLKPIHGSQGRNIIHIYRNGHNYHLEQTTFSNDSPLTFHSFSKLLLKIETWLQNKPYILQQGLPLASFNGRKVDFRLLCHKVNADNWKVTSSIARISGDHQFVSNLAQGGLLERPAKVLEDMFPKEKARQAQQLMSELALEAAAVLSERTDGLMAELGMDIGVDLNGSPFLIEINIKPSKLRDEPSPAIRPSVKAIYHYCENRWNERSYER